MYLPHLTTLLDFGCAFKIIAGEYSFIFKYAILSLLVYLGQYEFTNNHYETTFVLTFERNVEQIKSVNKFLHGK